MQCQPVEAFRRYGHALELRVGYHANTWNYHHHVGLTGMLEALFIPQPTSLWYPDGARYTIGFEICHTTIQQQHILLSGNITLRHRNETSLSPIATAYST